MNTRKIFILALTILGTTLGMSAYTFAAPTTPNPDAVIAQWPVDVKRTIQAQPLSEADKLSEANQYLSQASRPGQSRFYGLAQASLQPLITQGTANSQVWLAWAQIQQHQHRFATALESLQKVLQQDPYDTTANLLAARIQLIQGNHAQARKACVNLLGHSDLLTASACLLEVTSQQPEKLAESYKQLEQLVKRERLGSDESSIWISQLLADMAMRLGDYKTAEHWLFPLLPNASVNLLAQWAQTQLALGEYQEVITYLSPIISSAAEQDEALLLPLAIAEKSLESIDKSANKNWQTQLAERVALREQRQDKQHANELARFFLEIDPQPQKALYWAQVHYESSREASDKQLLERAQAAARHNSGVL
jgi:Tfp pilus assembly protein PilF